MVDLEVIGPDSTKRVTDAALIDTGANESAFPLHWRALLGIRYADCRRRRVLTANGYGKKLVYLDGIEAIILGRRVRLSGTFTDTPMALLGRSDFLEAFRLTVDQPNRRFWLVPYEERETSET